MITRRHLVAGSLVSFAATATGVPEEAPRSLPNALDGVLAGDLADSANGSAAVDRAVEQEERRFIEAATKIWESGPRSADEELRLWGMIDVLGRIGGAAAVRLLSAHLRFTLTINPMRQIRLMLLPEFYPCAMALARIGIPSVRHLASEITDNDDESARILACSTIRLIAQHASAPPIDQTEPHGATLAKAFIKAATQPKSDTAKQRVDAALAFLSLPWAQVHAIERRHHPR